MPDEKFNLQTLTELYNRGLFRQAHEVAASLGPMHQWPGDEAQVMAGRLLYQLGSFRRATAWHLRAWRRSPKASITTSYAASAVINTCGPLRGLRFIDEHLACDHLEDDHRGDLWGTRATLLASLRDFDEAETSFVQARKFSKNPAWFAVQQSYARRAEDRIEESLGLAQEAMNVHAWYLPAVLHASEMLSMLRRNDEAVALLDEAGANIESGWVHIRLAHLHHEVEQYSRTRAEIDKAISLFPMIDARGRDAFADMAADAAYFCGDYAAAAEWGSTARTPAFKKIAENIRNAPPQARRVLLTVPTVVQRHKTCAPATLSAISNFWGRSVDQMQIAEKICYDGTPMAFSRKWAVDQGFVVREFTLSWDVARAVIDRGVPFAICTVGTSSAHMSAIAGYDERRGTFLFRDPSDASLSEGFALEFLEAFENMGPRAMAMVPTDRMDLLAGISLPDAELLDHSYDLHVALLEHNRVAAADAAAQIHAMSPGHRLAHEAALWLALYDHDLPAQLVALDSLIALFPKSEFWIVRKTGVLQELGRKNEVLKLQEQRAQRLHASAIALADLARSLLGDASEAGRTRRLVRRALRAEPYNADYYFLLGGVHWRARQVDESLTAYRFALSIDDKNETHARAYFSASRYLRQTDRALAFLRGRFERHGSQSSSPAQTLYFALDELDLHTDAMAVIDRALALRPNDGDLLLLASEASARVGRLDAAEEYLTQAEGHCRQTDLLKARAQLAHRRGDLGASREFWRRIAELDPFDMSAHSQLAARLGSASWKVPNPRVNISALNATNFPTALTSKRRTSNGSAKTIRMPPKNHSRASLRSSPNRRGQIANSPASWRTCAGSTMR